jgi:hypothetical protein
VVQGTAEDKAKAGEGHEGTTSEEHAH